MPDLRDIIEAFDRRASHYARNQWHRRSAERLVELCGLEPGLRVLDAATGTGFAALAAARAVGPGGRVLGVDVSQGMLREARAAVQAAAVGNLDLLGADAAALPQFADHSFDAVTCACGLLYLPVGEALREWHRLLRPGGVMAFSAIRAGSPLAARLFRECAAGFGVTLADPCASLGSEGAARRALEAAGFAVTAIRDEPVEFSAGDLALAWESNSRSAAYVEVGRLNAAQLEELRARYLERLALDEQRDAAALRRVDVVYALGRR